MSKCFKVQCIAGFLILSLMISCLKRDQVVANSDKKTETAARPDTDDSRKTWPQIVELMGKARKNDPEAAYDLLRYYTFSESNPTAAYFWAVQAQRIGHPMVNDDVIKSAEYAVWSVLPSEDRKIKEVDPAQESILPEE